MTRNAIALFLTLPFLAACGTPQERCIDRGVSEYRTVSNLLAGVEANLERGYAWGERETVRSRLDHCRSWRRDRDGNAYPVMRPCWRDYVDVERFRVPIDPVVEQRKRDNLARRQAELAGQAEAYVRACKAAYPEEGELNAQAPA